MKKPFLLIITLVALLNCTQPSSTDNKENEKTMDSLQRETTIDKTNAVPPKDTFSYDRMPVKDSVPR